MYQREVSCIYAITLSYPVLEINEQKLKPLFAFVGSIRAIIARHVQYVPLSGIMHLLETNHVLMSTLGHSDQFCKQNLSHQ